MEMVLGENSQLTILAALIGERKVGHYYPQDLAALIELGLLNCETPVYHYQFKKWYAAKSLKEIRDLLSAKVLNRILEGAHFKAPEFLPPPPPVEPPFSLSEFSNVAATEIGGLQKDKEFLEREIDSLKAEVRDKENSLINAQTELKEVKKEVKNWQDQAWELKTSLEEEKKTFHEFKEETEEMRIGYESLKAAKEDDEHQFAGIEERLKDALQENNKLAKAVKKLARDKSKLLTYTEDLEKQLNGALQSREGLKKDLKKKEVDLVKLKKREAKARKIIRGLDQERNTLEAAREVDLKRLIGESFEVSNEPMWFIKRAGEQKGPYRFSDVLEWVEKGYLDYKTLMKKANEKTFSRMEKIYEFNTKIFTKMDKEGDTLKKRYFIKRTDFRAPFYEVAKLDLKGEEIRGHCTSLSVGGCFIEFSDMPENMDINSVLSCHISADYLSTPIDVQMIVRNLSSQKPYGIGCEFLDLSNEEKDTIEEFVDSYLHSRKETNKVA